MSRITASQKFKPLHWISMKSIGSWGPPEKNTISNQSIESNYDPLSHGGYIKICKTNLIYFHYCIAMQYHLLLSRCFCSSTVVDKWIPFTPYVLDIIWYQNEIWEFLISVCSPYQPISGSNVISKAIIRQYLLFNFLRYITLLGYQWAEHSITEHLKPSSL